MTDEAIRAIERSLNSSDTPPRDIQELLARLGEAQSRRDRSRIGGLVVWLYVGVVALAIAYLLYLGVVRSEDVTDDIVEIVKVFVIPVVTLVMGFYFGSSDRGSR